MKSRQKGQAKMNRKRNWLIDAALVVFIAMALGMAHAEQPAYVNGVRVDGAILGEWTHDWEAAVAAAKKDEKPIFINFTGSDWCGWCKLLKQRVFSKNEWITWASKNVYLVHIDFPHNKELVPEKYLKRNQRLAQRYYVGGYPTCYLLNYETLNPLGRFGASRDITVSAFIERVSAAMPGLTRSEATKPSKAQRQLERPENPQNTATNSPEF